MSKPSQFSLLTQRRFAPFFWVQFLGAFNDNLFKTALMVILGFEAASWTTMSASTRRAHDAQRVFRSRRCGPE